MENTRLLVLLASLSKKERRLFKKVVYSPFFNSRDDVIQLFDYLADCLWIYRVMPTKQQVFTKVFGKAPYEDYKVRIAMSHLTKLIEHFLTYQSFFSDEITVKTRLAQIYRQRQLPKQFNRAYRDAEERLSDSPYQNAEFFEQSYQLQLEAYNFHAARKRINELNLQEIADTLDIAYLSQKLRQTCYAISHQTVYKAEYQFGMVPELLKYVEDQDLLEVPAIALYYHCYYTLRGPGQEQHFLAFKNLILKHDGHFPPDEMRDLYLFAINYCLRDYNQGSTTYVADLLDLYRSGLEKKYLLSDGRLSRFTYLNVATLGLILEEYEWLNFFLKEYKSTLEPAVQESIYSFCMARLAYSQKNYDQALVLLQQVEYKDLLLNLSAKTVMLKIYYEWEAFDLLEAHLEAMMVFLRRKKVMGYHKENYTNTIRMTRKLLELQPYDKVGKQNLRKEIEGLKHVAERSWLLQCLDKI